MTLRLSTDPAGHAATIVDMFAATFATSEGAEEGALIGDLVRNFLHQADVQDVHVFLTWDGSALVGGCILSRLDFPQDLREVYLLSPVAVATDWQGQGVGQAMLRNALQTLRAQGADVAVTYGDPAFYGKVGFMPVSGQALAPPHPLGQPEGWLAQSLTNAPLTPFVGPSRCAKALDDPAYW